MNDETRAPIIIKRIKKVAGGHHGGAWKIAYADFVTAMMAFFLLMWLLGSTAEGDRKGIAEYFQTPLRVAMAGGSGSGDASSVIQGGGEDLTRSAGQVARSAEPARRQTINLQAARAELARQEAEKLEGLKRRFEEAIQEQREARAVQEPDSARDHGRRSASHRHRRAESRDVRYRRRRGEGLHARRHARDRRFAERRRQRDLARGPHRRRAVRGRRAGLLELGAIGRSCQRVAPRARRRRHEGEQDPAGRRVGLVVAARSRRTL